VKKIKKFGISEGNVPNREVAGPTQHEQQKIFDPDPLLGLVSHIWTWKISPKNSQFCPFGSETYLHVRSKNIRVNGRLAPYLLRVKSMPGLSQGPSLAEQT